MQGYKKHTFPCFLYLNRLERDRQPLNCPVDREKLSRDKVREFANAITFMERVGEFNLFTPLIVCRKELMNQIYCRSTVSLPLCLVVGQINTPNISEKSEFFVG